jgi:hypothetical protein
VTARARAIAIIGGAVLLAALILTAGVMVGRGCSRPVVVPAGIDAGPGDRAIAADLDGAVQSERERLDALVAEQQGELAALGAEDAAEFAAAKRRGREALAAWFAARMPDGGVR